MRRTNFSSEDTAILTIILLKRYSDKRKDIAMYIFLSNLPLIEPHVGTISNYFLSLTLFIYFTYRQSPSIFNGITCYMCGKQTSCSPFSVKLKLRFNHSLILHFYPLCSSFCFLKN